MTTTVAEAAPPAALSFKVATVEVEAPGTVEVHEDEGVVEAIVSVTGIEDEVADIIVPGAYADTLARRRPKVVWHHSWEQPIGRVKSIEELKPGDPRLPAQTKDGKAWPSEAGGLLATMEFNLKSERGREAFEAVRFYSETGECEWSIGYRVPQGKSTRDKKGVRHIKALDLYEISYVLFGAASQTGTLGLKAAVEAAHLRMERKVTTGEDPGAEAAMHEVMAADVQTKDDSQPGEAPPGTEPVVDPTPPEVTPPNTEPVADTPDDQAATEGPEGDGEDSGENSEPPADDGASDSEVTEEQIEAAMTVLLDAMTDDDFDAALAGLADEDRTYLDTLSAALSAASEPGEKAITPGGRVGDDSPVGTPGGRQNWVDQTGGLPRYIRMVAHALQRQGMSASRAIATAVATMKRWAAGLGNVSAKVKAAAAKAIAEWEANRARAHADNKGLVPGFQPGGVLPERRFQARIDHWSPVVERGEFAGVKAVTPTSHREFPRVEGTFEERIEKVRKAVCEVLKETGAGSDDEGPESSGYVSIDGTWPDRVIATRINYTEGESDRESYEMNYVIADDGEVTLSEPEPVKLTVYVESPDGDETDPETPLGDLLPVPEMVEAAAYGAKALLFAQQETKAGRVLSGVNEARLKAALESLIAVLRAAGIELDDHGPKTVLPPQRDVETTAPSAERKTLDPEAVKALLASLRD